VRAGVDVSEPAHNLARIIETKGVSSSLYLSDDGGNGAGTVCDGVVRDAKSGAGSV
jgi:hypothetical protein